MGYGNTNTWVYHCIWKKDRSSYTVSVKPNPQRPIDKRLALLLGT